MIIRTDNNTQTDTIRKMFELIWDTTFPHIDFLVDVKVFQKVSFIYDYVNREGKVILDMSGEESSLVGFAKHIEYVELIDKINYAQLNDWKVYLISSYHITEHFLTYIVNDINRRKVKSQFRK